jgi:hypothetical protein
LPSLSSIEFSVLQFLGFVWEAVDQRGCFWEAARENQEILKKTSNQKENEFLVQMNSSLAMQAKEAKICQAPRAKTRTSPEVRALKIKGATKMI